MLNIIISILLLLNTLQKSDVYFTKDISSKNIVNMFKKLNVKLEGKVGLKVHTGEIGGKYFLRPSFLQEIYDYTEGTFIECNTAYTSYDRHTTDGHMRVLKENGWLDDERRMVIMDANPENDKTLQVENHNNISVNYVGERLYDFDSCLVLAHFKGHAMGGFGGAMKQLSIGFASRAGKANIHSGGFTLDYNETWSHKAEQSDFTAAMADAASTIVKYFRSKKGIVFINVLANISTLCDCGNKAPEPRVRDIGILASTDPVAIDKACYDLILKENTNGSNAWKDWANERLALHTLEVAEKLNVGTQDYNLIEVEFDDLWYVYYIIIPIGGLLIIGLIITLIVIKVRKGKKEKLLSKNQDENAELGSAVISRAE